MKKILLLLLALPLYFYGSAQAYQQLRFEDVEYVTIESHSGIEVRSITPQADGSYSVELFNSNYNNRGEQAIYTFDWYLSYKGKRVSDYNKSTLACRRSKQQAVWIWPDEVPKGYERYVSVQLGREPIFRDRRDDD